MHPTDSKRNNTIIGFGLSARDEYALHNRARFNFKYRRPQRENDLNRKYTV